MKGVRLIAWYLLGIAAVIVLQTIPHIGIFLMFLAAMLWPAFLFNAMLLHVGHAAIAKDIERAWLVLPLVVYAGWVAICVLGYKQAWGLYRSVNAANKNVPRLSPDDRTFIIRGQDKEVTTSTAWAFAQVFKDSQIYALDRRIELASGERCKFAPKSEWKFDRSTVRVDTSTTHRPSLNSACLLSKPEPAPLDGIVVDVRNVSDTPWFVRWSSARALTISRTGAGRTAEPIGEIRQGTVEYFPPFPIFLAGCALSGAARWRCEYSIWRLGVPIGYSYASGYKKDTARALSVAELLGVPHY